MASWTTEDKYTMDFFVETFKIMVFCGNDPAPSKIYVNNRVLGRAHKLYYLSSMKSDFIDLDILKNIMFLHRWEDFS